MKSAKTSYVVFWGIITILVAAATGIIMADQARTFRKMKPMTVERTISIKLFNGGYWKTFQRNDSIFTKQVFY